MWAVGVVDAHMCVWVNVDEDVVRLVVNKYMSIYIFILKIYGEVEEWCQYWHRKIITSSI